MPPPDGVFSSVTVGDGAARATVDPGYASRLCEGHFPGDPLVPGAYQAELMAALGAYLFSDATGPAEMIRCVFRLPVRPSERIEVEARRGAGSMVDATLRAGGKERAEARFRFGDAP